MTTPTVTTYTVQFRERFRTSLPFKDVTFDPHHDTIDQAETRAARLSNHYAFQIIETKVVQSVVGEGIGSF